MCWVKVSSKDGEEGDGGDGERHLQPRPRAQTAQQEARLGGEATDAQTDNVRVVEEESAVAQNGCVETAVNSEESCDERVRVGGESGQVEYFD